MRSGGGEPARRHQGRRLLAPDAKLNFDDNALYRHKELAELRDIDEEDPLEVQAQESGIGNYVKLTGTSAAW